MSDSQGATSQTGARWSQVAFGVVLAATLALAALHYWQFLQDPRPRWNGIEHDRNGHYEFAQKMALALREANFPTFFSTLEKAKVWPPVHGLLAAAVLAVGGLDYRLAVLPSLTGWIMTVVFGFLLARKISAGCGNTAGIIAAVMIVASPAHRIYGTDIMLESLGAGLTMMVLYLYAVAKQEPSIPTWRRLAIALTVLFFEKYNYWFLVVMALGIAEVSGWRRQEWNHVTGFFRRLNRVLWWREQLRQPFNYLFAVAALITTAIFIWKPSPLHMGSRTISLYPPNNLVTLTYAILFLRVILQWKRIKATPAIAQILKWHCLPVAASFLLPRRLSAFVWYLGPLNKSDEGKHSIGDSVALYCHSITADYHVALWSAIWAGSLLFLALATCRKWRVGGQVVLWLALLSAVSVLAHPNQKSRFLHSWLPSAWVAGAVGLATCIERTGRLRGPLSVTAGLAVALAHAPWFANKGHASEAGCRGETTSLLDISDAYLPSLANMGHVAVYSTAPCAQFVLWTYRERYHQQNAIELRLGDHDWSHEIPIPTDAEAVLFIDMADEASATFPPKINASEQLGKWMSGNRDFHLLGQWEFPQNRCVVTLWTRGNAAVTNAIKTSGRD